MAWNGAALSPRKFGEFPESALKVVPSFVPDAQILRDGEGYVQLKMPRPRTFWWRFLCFIFKAPDYRIITLDETGSEMAALIDGKTTFSELSEHLAAARTLEEGQARESMAAFLRRLGYEGVIRLAGRGEGSEGSGG
jgi:hypothetical protein